MTATRTDVHRPSALEFDPADYVCLGVFDLNTSASDWVGPGPAATVAAQVALGNTFHGAPHGSGQCSHCGAYFRYGALMLHEKSKTLLYVGETCLDNRFSLTKGEFDALRKASALNRERVAKAERLDALVARHPVLAWASYAHNIDVVGGEWVEDEDEYQGGYVKPGTSFGDRARVGWEVSTLSDIWGKVERYGDPSEKQVAFVGDLVRKITVKGEALEAREQAQAALVASGVTVPEGRIVVEGEVLATKTEETYYGYGRQWTTKMLVQSDEGWKVWGTMPSALEGIGVDKGSRVRFSAKVTPSGDDPVFGFYSRPTKAEVV